MPGGRRGMKAKLLGGVRGLRDGVDQRRKRPHARPGRSKNAKLEQRDTNLELRRTVRQPLDMTQSPFGEAAGLDIREQTQGALAGDRAGSRRRLVIVGECGMIGEICGKRGVALARAIQGARDMPMKQLSPRLRDAAIGGLPDQVMGEVVGVVADRPHEPAPLQFAKSREQFGGVEARGAREIVRREGAAIGRRPEQHLARLFREPRELAGDNGLDGRSRFGLAAAMSAGKLQRKQRIALALGKDARAIERRIDQANKLASSLRGPED